MLLTSLDAAYIDIAPLSSAGFGAAETGDNTLIQLFSSD